MYIKKEKENYNNNKIIVTWQEFANVNYKSSR